jgi:hypothetical protein
MFAYFIIGVELAILYGVFWYVFIREPKPYEVKSGQWGTYQYDSGCFTAYGASQHRLPVALSDGINDDELYAYYSDQADTIPLPMLPPPRKSANRHRVASLRNLPQSALVRKEQQLRYGWVSAQVSAADRGTVEKFFRTLSRAINQLTLRLP